MLYDVWWSYYGEFAALGIWGIFLVLARSILFGKLKKSALLEGGEKSRMLRAMTLKFEKSHEIHVEIQDIPVFVKKYLYQEKGLGIRLLRWRRLPERWTKLILGVGILEAVILYFLGYSSSVCVDRLVASIGAATVVWMALIWFEADSLWEQTEVFLTDYVANTLCPRQNHVYEQFDEVKPDTGDLENEKTLKPLVLKEEEEKLFQEVLTEFLGSST